MTELDDHSLFVRNLARRLLRDDDAADDVVQETMLAAVKARPSTDRPLRPWLATVARNVIRKRFRSTDRRRRRETAAARPEAVGSTADLAARTEILQRVVDAVLSLDEPGRTAILLRYYEDLPPREIARRLGVPVETVRGRIKRAVKKLRVRLDDAHPGGRAGWMPALAGLCGYELPAELAAAGSGTASSAGGSGPGAASGGAAGAAGALPALVGAFVLGGLAAGLVAWRVPPSSRSVEDAPAAARRAVPTSAPAPVAPRPTAPPVRAAPDPGRLERARAANATLRATRDDLAATLRDLEPAPLDPSLFAFGWPEGGSTIAATDWPSLARHVRAMTALMPGMRATVTSGEDVELQVRSALGRHNTPLVAFAVAAAAELGTPHPNLAFTHPAVLANLVAALLDLHGLPLTPEQRREVRLLGASWATAAASAPPVEAGAPALAAVIDAVEVRSRFAVAMKQVLTPEQHVLLFPPEVEDRVQLDLLSPALAYALRRGVPAADPAALRREMVARLLALGGVQGQDPALFSRVAESWLDALPGVDEPTPWYAIDLAFPSLEELQALARAQLRAIESILASGRLAPEEAASLREVTMLLVPQIPAGDGTLDPTGR